MSTAEAISAGAGGLLDVERFAERVLGRPLWRHQVELARSPARYRVVCAGRQVGKSTLLAVLALFEAATHRNRTILLVSAGEVASRRLLADCADLATNSSLLSGSVLDENSAALTLSTGSRILSVPASQRQIRGWPVDLLIVDEAGFIADEIWQAAEPATIARPDARIILASSPWGSVDHWFRRRWQRGMDSPDREVASFHWPSSANPLVSAARLASIREGVSGDVFAREYLAEWADDSGAFFTEAEIMGAVADYELLAPDRIPELLPELRTLPVAAGVDWGVSRDANALVLMARMTGSLDGRARLFLPWVEARHGWPFTQFIDRIVQVAANYRVRVIASERNGIGEYPTSELQDRLHKRDIRTRVVPVWTDLRRKQSGFGRLKGLLQSGRLVLPAHPPLLRELRSLQFEQLTGGGVRIAVPDNAGHDDMAMALLQAVSCVDPGGLRDEAVPFGSSGGDVVVTGGGVRVPARPRPDRHALGHIVWPAGAEPGDGW